MPKRRQVKTFADGISASVESSFINNFTRLRGTKVADDSFLNKVNVHIDNKYSKLPMNFDFAACRFEPLADIDHGAQTNDWSITASQKWNSGMSGYFRVGQFNYENKQGANSNNFEAGAFVPNSVGGKRGIEVHHTPEWDNISVTLSNSASREIENGATVSGKMFVRGFKVNDNPEFVAGYST